MAVSSHIKRRNAKSGKSSAASSGMAAADAGISADEYGIHVYEGSGMGGGFVGEEAGTLQLIVDDGVSGYGSTASGNVHSGEAGASVSNGGGKHVRKPQLSASDSEPGKASKAAAPAYAGAGSFYSADATVKLPAIDDPVLSEASDDVEQAISSLDEDPMTDDPFAFGFHGSEIGSRASDGFIYGIDMGTRNVKPVFADTVDFDGLDDDPGIDDSFLDDLLVSGSVGSRGSRGADCVEAAKQDVPRKNGSRHDPAGADAMLDPAVSEGPVDANAPAVSSVTARKGVVEAASETKPATSSARESKRAKKRRGRVVSSYDAAGSKPVRKETPSAIKAEKNDAAETSDSAKTGRQADIQAPAGHEAPTGETAGARNSASVASAATAASSRADRSEAGKIHADPNTASAASRSGSIYPTAKDAADALASKMAAAEAAKGMTAGGRVSAGDRTSNGSVAGVKASGRVLDGSAGSASAAAKISEAPSPGISESAAGTSNANDESFLDALRYAQELFDNDTRRMEAEDGIDVEPVAATGSEAAPAESRSRAAYPEDDFSSAAIDAVDARERSEAEAAASSYVNRKKKSRRQKRKEEKERQAIIEANRKPLLETFDSVTSKSGRKASAKANEKVASVSVAASGTMAAASSFPSKSSDEGGEIQVPTGKVSKEQKKAMRASSAASASPSEAAAGGQSPTKRDSKQKETPVPELVSYKGGDGKSTVKAQKRVAKTTSEYQAKKAARSGRLKVVAAVAVALLVTTAILYPPTREYYVSVRTLEKAEAQLSQLEEQNEELQSSIDDIATDDGIENYVREEYGWVMDGEQAVSVTGLTTDAETSSSSITSTEEAEGETSPLTRFLDTIFFVE